MSPKGKMETQIVGNTGMYYACYQLSARGWNVMPTARNARGIDLIAYVPDGSGFLGIQVKTLSYRNPVPVGKSLDKVMGDFWVIVVLTNPDKPNVYILTPKEVKRLAHESGKQFWIEPKMYDTPEFYGQWQKIFFETSKNA